MLVVTYNSDRLGMLDLSSHKLEGCQKFPLSLEQLILLHPLLVTKLVRLKLAFQ